MKKAVKRVSIIAGIILLVVIALHIALFAFINAKGKDLIVTGLKDNFGLEATVGSLSLKFPFKLVVKDFQCQVLVLDEASVSLGFFNPFTRSISLNKVYLDGLDLKVTKDNGVIALSLPVQNSSESGSKMLLPSSNSAYGNPGAGIDPDKHEESEPVKKKFSIAIGNLYIKNSRIEVDYPAGKLPLHIIFNDISLRLKGFTYPELSRFYLKLNTVLSSPFNDSARTNALSVKGLVDYGSRTMNVDVKIVDFDYMAFSEIYPLFWQPDNLKLKEAVLSLESKLKSRENNLTIDTLLTVENVEFIEEKEGEESFQAKTLKTVIAVLRGDKEKPTLHFKLNTKMDSPSLDFSSLRKSLLEAAGIGPLNVIEGAIGEVKEKIKSTGTTAVGGVLDAIKGAAGTIQGILNAGNGENP